MVAIWEAQSCIRTRLRCNCNNPVFPVEFVETSINVRVLLGARSLSRLPFTLAYTANELIVLSDIAEHERILFYALLYALAFFFVASIPLSVFLFHLGSYRHHNLPIPPQNTVWMDGFCERTVDYTHTFYTKYFLCFHCYIHSHIWFAAHNIIHRIQRFVLHGYSKEFDVGVFFFFHFFQHWSHEQAHFHLQYAMIRASTKIFNTFFHWPN